MIELTEVLLHSALFFCTVIFLILFAFIFFVFIVFLLAMFRGKKIYKKEFMPPVSVIIPVYNAEKFIVECISRVKENNYPALEIILADDGSTDNTVNEAKKFQGIKILSLQHKGKVNALNEGILAAKNELVLTLDADTFIGKNAIREIVKPFQDEKIGAASVTVKVIESNSVWNIFQEMEYLYNNLIRESFYRVFNNSVWFFGCMGCYRKSVLKKIGFFKELSQAEDMLASIEIKKAGFEVINVSDVEVKTLAPDSFKELLAQRKRWWNGGLQSLMKNYSLFSRKQNPAIIFLFINQFWWSFYSIIFFPILVFLVIYWFPFSQGVFEAASYLFRWFSVFGPFYVIYMIPQWGISLESIFGVLSGILMTLMLFSSIVFFRERLSMRKLIAIVFYFPYTIVINIIILLSLMAFKEKEFFIK